MNDSTFLPKGTLLALQYTIIGHIGCGGFGKTYLVEDKLGNRKVIKEFFISSMCTRDEASNSVTISVDENRMTYEEQLERFKNEAIRIHSLSHPHVVKVSAFFEDNNTAYYVMDYIEGESLAKKISKEKLSEQRISRYMHQLLAALDYIHSKGLTHLDIKPGNIMVDKDDNVVLIDFGASKMYNAQSINKSMMSSMRPPYTSGYAPAEQENGNVKDMGTWCDIYALGATLYTLYTGKRPNTPYEIFSQGEFPKITNASAKMQEVIEKSMAYMVKNRIKTVVEFCKVLDGEVMDATKIENEIDATKNDVSQGEQEEIPPRSLNNIKHIDWIGIGQFLFQNKRIDIVYKCINKYFRLFFIITVAIEALLLIAATYLTEICIENGSISYFFAKVLDDMEILNANGNYYDPAYDYATYDLDGYGLSILLILFGLAVIALILSIIYKNSILKDVYAIEESDNKFLRVRDEKGKVGLCKNIKYYIKEIMPIEYDAIYPCDDKVYICEQRGKKGVYNVELKKMMVPIENDEIEITTDNKLLVHKNGIITKYTTKGFKVI